MSISGDGAFIGGNYIDGEDVDGEDDRMSILYVWNPFEVLLSSVVIIII